MYPKIEGNRYCGNKNEDFCAGIRCELCPYGEKGQLLSMNMDVTKT